MNKQQKEADPHPFLEEEVDGKPEKANALPLSLLSLNDGLLVNHSI